MHRKRLFSNNISFSFSLTFCTCLFFYTGFFYYACNLVFKRLQLCISVLGQFTVLYFHILVSCLEIFFFHSRFKMSLGTNKSILLYMCSGPNISGKPGSNCMCNTLVTCEHDEIQTNTFWMQRTHCRSYESQRQTSCTYFCPGNPSQNMASLNIKLSTAVRERGTFIPFT